MLAEKLEEMEKGPLSRRGVKAEVAKKRKASKTKKAKRKYKKLDEEGNEIGQKVGEEEDLIERDEHGPEIGDVKK